MVDRLIWLIWRRLLLQSKLKGFKASMKSYANQNVSFSECNRLHGSSHINDSSLGRYTYVAGASVGNAIIGSFCSIGHDAIVGGLGRHPSKWLSTHPAFYSTKRQVEFCFSDRDWFDELSTVVIGSDVWIGARAIILDGVEIGHGAIIGAGAVVTKKVEPYSIVGGVPARVIRERYSPSHIRSLLDLRWWDWDNESLKKAAPIFREEGDAVVDKLIEFHRKFLFV